jgi:glycosyltransferase involved in cell wall biosynthesis
LKIALLALHFAEYASRLAVALSARHEVLLVLHTDNARRELTDELRQLVEQSVQVRYFKPRRMRDPRVLLTGRAVNRIIRDFAPEVLHIQEIHPVLGAGTMLPLHRAMPVVLTVHDPVSHSGDPRQDGWRWKVRVWLRHWATRLIVHGPRMRDELETMDSGFAGRVDAIAHGLLGNEGIDHDIGGHEPATFLFFGRIEPYKGLGFLLEAADLLRGRGHALRLVIAGTGTDLARHRAHIAGHAWIELIDRYVSATEIEGLFRRATAVVLPYTDATQSGVAAIALANSRPVISTAVGDLPDVVIDGRTGLLVPPCDGAALSRAMERLLVNSGLRNALAAGAGQYADEHLCWSRIAELTEATYRRAIDSHAARAGKTRAPGSATAPVSALSDGAPSPEARQRRTGSY